MYNPYTTPYLPNYNDMSKLDRLNYLQNTNPQMMNNYQTYQSYNGMGQQNQPQIGFDCKPVTSIDEAKATTIRLDGNPSYMVDTNAKSIYEKRLDMNTGAASFKTYKLLENSENIDSPQIDYSNIASKEDFVNLDKKVSELSQKQDDILLNLKNLIMNGVVDNESSTNVNINGKSKSNNTISSKK